MQIDNGDKEIVVPLRILFLLYAGFGGTGLDFHKQEEIDEVEEFIATVPEL